MPGKKLTDRFVQSLSYSNTAVEYTDTSPMSRGLRLRVNKSGKSFSCMYTAPDGRRKRFTLGHYPALSLKEARKVYNHIRSKIDSGEDPSFEKQQARLKAREGLTFSDIASQFMRRHAQINLKTKTISEYKNQLAKDILPQIGHRRVDNGDLTKRDLTSCVDKITDRGAMVKANRVTALLKAIFRWANEEGYIEENPSFGIRKRSKEKPRSRVLTDDEIRYFWNNFENEGVTEPVAIAAKLELVLGHRTSEITQQTKKCIQLDCSNPYWVIEESKNSQCHRLPLNQIATDLIKRAIELSGDSEFLFPSPINRFKPIGHHVVTKAILRRRDDLGFHFTSHDLRRTMNTRLAAMGINQEMRKRILNHKDSSGSADINEAVYNWHNYENEMRQILNSWGKQLTAIIENRSPKLNVIQIKPQAHV